MRTPLVNWKNSGAFTYILKAKVFSAMRVSPPFLWGKTLLANRRGNPSCRYYFHDNHHFEG